MMNYNRKVNFIFAVFFIIQCLFFSVNTVRAVQVEYVLPYPGVMPGNRLYIVSSVLDTLRNYWSFGSFSQFTYHLSMADKKLVESKTLFEYKQYLLASKALLVYQDQLKDAYYALGKARFEGKDNTKKTQLLSNAIAKHREVLEKLKNETPVSYLWTPEKDKPQSLALYSMLDNAIETGKQCGGGK